MTDRSEAAGGAVKRSVIMVALVVSGECIFILPFVLTRIFRPTFLDVFGLTNLQLGTAFAVIGVVAMLAYFPGGLLADRFPARWLMTLALVTTGLGGILLVTIPPLGWLRLLYGYWGLTTMILFWAAFLRATREWGGRKSQGSVFGLLDGGRGLISAVLASVSVAIFAALLPIEVASATLAERTAAFKQIIWIFTGLVFGVAVLVWLSIPINPEDHPSNARKKMTLDGVRKLLPMPALWLQATIIVCAYVGMKSTADFSLYARDAFGYDDVAAAQLATLSFWVRPFAAIGAGILGDRFGSSRMIVLCFLVIILGSLTIALGTLSQGIYWMIIATVVGTSAGIYALRGIYFALFEEAHIPMAYTGSAIGIISVIGYAPDIFTGPLFGYLLDRSPGALGHQHLFLVVTGFAIIGLLAALAFQKVTRRTLF
jgi:nitrate/nitrite transporter NarK